MNDKMEKAFMDQMKTMNDNIAAINAIFSPGHKQITAPLNPRFVDTPTPTPQPNLRPNTSSQPSPHNEQLPTANDTKTARWRGEELRTFNPAMDNVYTFTNRMHQVARKRGHALVQLNLSLQHRGLAKDWYERA